MTERAELSTGEALVGLLEDYGVELIFGIPGVHNIEMYRALPRSKIRHVLVRHEQGAGFMADGYARASGKPGVCFTITGPGVLNILTPIAQAWSDSSNMLVIATALDVTDSAQGRGRLHEMLDQRGAAATVTSLNMRAYTPKDVRDAVARAFANFASRRPRPAYIEVPLDVLKQPAGDGWKARGLPRMPVPEPTQVAAAIAKLSAAKRPAMILGGGALTASREALAVAEKLQCPVFTTVAGKGAIPAGHPLCMGYSLLDPETIAFLRSADCILCAGSELAETDFWDTSVLLEHNLIRIDIDPDSIARPHGAEIAILGDAAAALAAIDAGLSPGRKPWAAEAKAKLAGRHEDAVLVKVLAAIREALPPETIVCSDMTQIAYVANVMFPVERPHSWIHPVGFGTLGFGLPVGIGAKLGRPDAPVAVLHGDYGIQYTMNELGTAVEHKLPVIILLWNNERLGAIHDSMARAGIQPNNVTLKNPDFQALARAYGCAAAKPGSLQELALAIKAALKAEGPTLIEMTPRMVNG
jgi:5-guanidino-2-oxopentanoate decarboxylase